MAPFTHPALLLRVGREDFEINAIFNVRTCNIDAFWPILHQMFAGEETGGLSSFLSSILGLVQYSAFAKILLPGPISVFCLFLYILMC